MTKPGLLVYVPGCSHQLGNASLSPEMSGRFERFEVSKKVIPLPSGQLVRKSSRQLKSCFLTLNVITVDKCLQFFDLKKTHISLTINIKKRK